MERVERISATRADPCAERGDLEGLLRDVTALRGWLASAEADATHRLAEMVTFPEAAIADNTRESFAKAAKTIERAKTLDAAPDLASKLDDGTITSGHVAAVTRAAGGLEARQRDELIERCDQLSHIAEHASVEQWNKRVRDLARNVQRADGMDRYERQRRATTCSTWVDGEGMWNLRATFDPLTGVGLAAKLDRELEALFAEAVPEWCPTDRRAKQDHMRALALARLLEGSATSGRSGRAEYVTVIDVTGAPATEPADATAAAGLAGEPDWEVTWPIPIEVPHRVLVELMGAADAGVSVVIVRNGIVLYAPGELDLGRTTRLANRAQRRALRGLYSTCGIPGCRVSFDRCKLHHVIWWRHGGATDLANLLPVCSIHHGKIHHDNWLVTLGPNRELTVTLPDGSVMATGPPNRRAA